jgi:hypothetical protein
VGGGHVADHNSGDDADEEGHAKAPNIEQETGSKGAVTDDQRQHRRQEGRRFEHRGQADERQLDVDRYHRLAARSGALNFDPPAESWWGAGCRPLGA